MKTLDAIKEIVEDKNKEFESLTKLLFWDYELNCMVCEDKEDRYSRYSILHDITLKEEWKEVKQPVDFMTVVKSRKKVKVEHELLEEEQEEYLSLDILMFNLSNMHYEPDFTDIILNGKWYIED